MDFWKIYATKLQVCAGRVPSLTINGKQNYLTTSWRKFSLSTFFLLVRILNSENRNRPNCVNIRKCCRHGQSRSFLRDDVYLNFLTLRVWFLQIKSIINRLTMKHHKKST